MLLQRRGPIPLQIDSVSERRVTDVLAAIAAALAVVLSGVAVSPEQRRPWHALLAAEGADPNVGRATMKRGWAC